tara:strand:+ start:19 stop:486 length:468 start_codon:yes stop_codon:yes gene_type:complete
VANGLDKSGGISFSRKPKAKEEEPKEEVKEPRNVDIKELAKDERLNAKLRKAKGINYSGFAVNGTTIIGAMFYLDSLLIDPTTIDTLNMINDMFDTDINFEQIIATIQGYKAQIIGLAISSQTMLVQYKQTVQKMKDTGNESFYDAFNKELGKVI